MRVAGAADGQGASAGTEGDARCTPPRGKKPRRARPGPAEAHTAVEANAREPVPRRRPQPPRRPRREAGRELAERVGDLTATGRDDRAGAEADVAAVGAPAHRRARPSRDDRPEAAVGGVENLEPASLEKGEPSEPCGRRSETGAGSGHGRRRGASRRKEKDEDHREKEPAHAPTLDARGWRRPRGARRRISEDALVEGGADRKPTRARPPARGWRGRALRLGPTLALVCAGLALLVAAVAATLVWSWLHDHDWLPLTLVAAAAAELALAAGFHRVARLPRVAVTLERALIGAGFLVLFFLLPHGLFGDDNIRFADIEQLLHQGTLSTSKYSLVMPLVSVPVLALGNLVESRSWWADHFNVIVVALGVLAASRLLRGRIDARLQRRTVLVLLFASFLTDRLRDYNAEVLTGTLVALGTICLATGRHVGLGWAAIVIGAVNTPAAVVGLVCIAAVEVARTRRLRHLLPIAAAAALIMLESWIRRGSPLDTGYSGNEGVKTIMPYSGLPGFSYPFLLGLVAILFSFGRGLLFFTPGLALWLPARTRALVPERRWLVLMLAFTLGLVLVYAKWWAWYGGIAWGPRFFAFAALPASVLLAARIHRAGESRGADLLTLGVLVLSAWVACAGTIADLDAVASFCGSNNFQNEQLCWFTPDYSSLWQPVRQFPTLTTATTAAALYCGLVLAHLAAPLLAALLRPLRLERSPFAGWRL